MSDKKKKQLTPAKKRSQNFFQGGNTASGTELTKAQISKQNEKLSINKKNGDNKKSSSTKTDSTTKSQPKDDGGKAAWLKKTRNSPAAKSGAFTDDERWALQQKHRKSKAARAVKSEVKKHANKGTGRDGTFGKGTHGKGMPSNPQLKTQTTKDKRDPNRHKVSDDLKIEKDKKKKKKNVPPGTRLAKMFDD